MFNIKGDLKVIRKSLSRLQKKQIPFAASLAINATLFDIRKAEVAQIYKKLDRPTKFTAKGFLVNKSRKTNLTGSIEIPANRWKYMKYQVEGGTRTRNVIVPTNASKLNVYGNIKGIWSGSGSKKTFTKAKKKYVNKQGVWQKTGGKRNPQVKLIAAFVRSARYKKRFPFYKIAEGVTHSRFKKNLMRKLAYALRTAR